MVNVSKGVRVEREKKEGQKRGGKPVPCPLEEGNAGCQVSATEKGGRNVRREKGGEWPVE